MKNILTVIVLFITGTAFASTPDYTATKTEIEEEAEARQEEIADEVPLESVPFRDDVTPDDIIEGQETGQFNTALSRREGEPTLQERMRAMVLQWEAEKIAEIAELEDDLTDATERITRHTDGDDSDGLDILAQQEAADEKQYGPKAKEADPAFAKADSTALNPAPHAASQVGDSCMSNTGNTASLTVDPIAPTYENPCEGDSDAEHNDCTMGAFKEINGNSNATGANSDQAMQPTVLPNSQQLQTAANAKNASTDIPSCPTAPRLAESKMDNVSDLISAERQSFEQADLVAGRTSTALSQKPKTESYVQVKILPWYKNLLAWMVPSIKAQTTTTLVGATDNAGRENELAKQDFAKFISDAQSYPDMAGEQLFANRMSQMMEEHNKINRTKLELTKQLREDVEKRANKPTKGF